MSDKPHEAARWTRVAAGAKYGADAAGRHEGRLRRFLRRHRDENLKGRDIYRIARRVSPVYMMEIKYEKAEVRENVVRSENKMENMQRAEIKLKLQQ